MKMRKILSFVLVLSLVLGSFSMAFAATPADVVGTPSEEAVTVLMGLGVVDGYEDGSFKPEGIVTRAEMAKLIVVALGLEDYATGTSKYPDMAGATWAQGYINYATGLGVIEGYPDGTFKPSQTVSFPEASAMIVRALGYTEASLLPATWPANYVVKAKALGILDDVTTSVVGADRGSVAQMLYNALTVNMVSVDTENKVTVIDPEDNMLLRLGAEKVEADVIYGNEDTLINLVPYTGAYAEVYTIDGDIVAVDLESTEIKGIFEPASGVVKGTGAGIIDESGTSADYNVSAAVAAIDVPYFWNGVQEPTSSNHPKYSIDTVTTGTPFGEITFNVDLSGKTVKDVYGISYWIVSTADLFTADDAETILDDQSLFNNDFILDDNDEIDLNQFVLEGANTLADIDVDDVVYVFNGWHSAGIKKIQVGTETVTGKVTEQDGGDYTINGKVYNLAINEVADKGSLPTPESFEVGDTITARLDYNGYIFDVEVGTGAPDLYAIVMDTVVDSFDGDRAKLFTSDDATKTYVVEEDVDLVADDTLVEYTLDKDGEIDKLEAEAIDATSLYLTSSKIVRVNNTKTYAVDSDVVVFTVDDDGDYSIMDMADVTTGEEVAAANSQVIIEDGYIVAMLLDAELAGTTDDGYFAVFNSEVAALDADDNIVQKLTGFVDGAAAVKYTDDTDVINLGTEIELWNLELDADGIITDATTEEAVVEGAVITDMTADKTAIQTATGWFAIADGATVYLAEEDGGYEYSVSSISALRDGYEIYLFDTDTDEDGYETVIFEK